MLWSTQNLLEEDVVEAVEVEEVVLVVVEEALEVVEALVVEEVVEVL